MLLNLMVVMALLTLLWAVSVWLKDASIIDPFWGLGFVVIAWVSRASAPIATLAGTWLILMVTIWGIRLFGYLTWRNWSKGEDRRYGAMRTKHGDKFWWVSLFTVYWLQGILMWIISLPVQAAILNPVDLAMPSVCYLLVGIGTVIWLIGWVFETVGDYQMSRFKSNPENKGKVMDQGLWRYTRHPNYFGDFCIWWGLYLTSTALGGWWTIFSPLLMSFLLMKVSGVTMLESDIEERRPNYARYKRTTSPFFPRIPKPLVDLDWNESKPPTSPHGDGTDS